MFIKKISMVLGCLLSWAVIAAPNPASQEWVLAQLAVMSSTLTTQIANVNTTLTTSDWAAVCNAGSSPNTGAGCYLCGYQFR